MKDLGVGSYLMAGMSRLLTGSCLSISPTPFGVTPSVLEATLSRMLEAGMDIRPIGAVCAELLGDRGSGTE